MQFFDIVTAVTLTGIIAIITLYIVVVYKKGWLKKNSKGSESYFLCPNTKCRRVFKDPIWLTDLSKAPPESYQACPHCSTSLQISPSFHSSQRAELDSRPAQKAHFSNKELRPENEGITRVPKQTPKNNLPKRLEKSISTQQLEKPIPTPDIHKESPSKPSETLKDQDEKSVSERPRACSHYFGYVRTLPKNTSIPDECLWCPWIVKCLTGTEKVEA